ncbi:MAG: DNA-binding protein [Peptococcaceae bacterium]|nr:MAG: DNA-binding protein [Peptococcaceae bacterium]
MKPADWDEYPLVLSPADVKRILGCGSNNVYALFHRKDFPVVRIGRTLKVSREAFRNWLEREQK